jgi:WD40 repeat protein
MRISIAVILSVLLSSLCRADDPRLLSTLQAHKGAVRAVALRPHGDLLASAGDDGYVKLWWDGTNMASFDHGSPVSSMAFSNDGSMLGVVGRYDTVRVWEVKAIIFLCVGEGYPSRSIVLRELPFESVAFQEGRIVFGQDLLANWAKVWTTAPNPSDIEGQHAVYTPLVSGSTIELQDETTGKCAATFQAGQAAVSCVAISRNGETLASGGDDGVIRFWRMPGEVGVRP